MLVIKQKNTPLSEVTANSEKELYFIDPSFRKSNFE
jgi:hypothetical protein